MQSIGFILYLVAIGLIGIAAYRRSDSANAYLLGNRGLPSWIAGLSAGASDMSGWLLLGLPGLAYVSATESAWVALGLLIGTYLNWRFVAHRLRVQSEALGDALTIPEFLERRFGDHSAVLRRVSAILILVFFTFYTAAGFIAGGKLFETVFDLPYHYAVMAGGLIVVVYTCFGGFLAVSWTDAMQASLMALALVGIAMLSLFGSSSASAHDYEPVLAVSVSNVTLLSSLAWGLGYAGQPHILARFMAIKHPDSVRSARYLATTWTAICLVAAIGVGIAGHYELDTILNGADRETVFIALISQLLHPALAGICLAAVLAAIMSTADSQLLVAAAALTHDLLPKKARQLRYHRYAVVGVCLVAINLAFNPEAKVLDMVAYAWAGFGAALGPVMLCGLYAPHTHRYAALLGMLSGAVTIAVWDTLDGGYFDVYALLPGFVVGFSTIVATDRAIRWFR